MSTQTPPPDEHARRSSGLRMSVQYLKGVGPARAAQLERLGLRTVSDILLGVPRRYEDRSRRLDMATMKFGDEGIVAGKVERVLWHPGKGARSKAYLEVVLTAGFARCFCRWYNARYLEERFTAGLELEVYGKVMRQAGRTLFYHPDWRVTGQVGADDREWEGLLPVYALTEDLPQRVMRKIVGLAVDQHVDTVTEALPNALRERLGLPGISEALRTIHFPTRMADAARARRRLVFEEFLCMQLALRQRHGEERRVAKGHVYPPSEGLRQRFIEQLPFTFTKAQSRCLDEILHDMRSPHPMHRLLQGDVGSGKTVVAASAMLEAVESGFQCALLAPTEVLASQHFQGIGRYLFGMGVDCALLTGDTSAPEQRRARTGLRTGRIKAVVGTHALLYDKVDFDHLALVVIDEQHKFGVEQRARLLAKGAHPDVLVMSATPIPRTLAMTVFGDLDVSTIDELPANRQSIVTRVINSEKLDEAYVFTRGQLEKGRQAFIIYPLVEESETLELKAAKTMFEHLSTEVFPGLNLGLLHGKMGAQEKARVMADFREGRAQILVATTVVEVGVDVPNASVMIVENAERFGLAQLHQLRGRIGRGAHKSYCILQGDPKSEDAWRRLKIMEETRDGFRIAEEDLKIRGMGNLLGTEQSGFPELKVGDPVRDADMLMVARREAIEQCALDPDGLDPEWALLRKQAARFFAERGQLTQAG